MASRGTRRLAPPRAPLLALAAALALLGGAPRAQTVMPTATRPAEPLTLQALAQADRGGATSLFFP